MKLLVNHVTQSKNSKSTLMSKIARIFLAVRECAEAPFLAVLGCSKFNFRIQFQNSFSEFIFRIQFQNSISKFNSRIQFQNSISEFNFKIHFQNSFLEFNFKIQFQNSYSNSNLKKERQLEPEKWIFSIILIIIRVD